MFSTSNPHTYNATVSICFGFQIRGFHAFVVSLPLASAPEWCTFRGVVSSRRFYGKAWDVEDERFRGGGEFSRAGYG